MEVACKKKRRDHSVKEKIRILEQYDKFPKINQRDAAKQLNISQPVLCKILKTRVEIESAAKKHDNLDIKRNRTGKDEQVESALKLWYTTVRQPDARVDGPMMRQKAEELAKKMGKETFVATEGWFCRWKKRENIVYKRTYGEQKDADFITAEYWIENVWKKIALEFTPNDIFNADETGLYYRGLPEHAYLFKNENSKGCKTSKDHITVLCCANMTGDKKNLLVIGKSKHPRCFKGIKTLPVDYRSNKNAWMTSLLFNEWLLKWDNMLDRKIALLVDNCTAHRVNCHLKNIKVIFLPDNTTSLIQPCDQGIIRTMKAYYRKEMRVRILKNMSSNDLAEKTNLLDAIHLIAASWDKVSTTTIKNCFKHGGLSKEVTEDENLKIEPPDMATNEFEEWMAIDDNIKVAENLTEEDICESVMCKSVELQAITNCEMRKALGVLRRGVQKSCSDLQRLCEQQEAQDVVFDSQEQEISGGASFDIKDEITIDESDLEDYLIIPKLENEEDPLSEGETETSQQTVASSTSKENTAVLHTSDESRNTGKKISNDSRVEENHCLNIIPKLEIFENSSEDITRIEENSNLSNVGNQRLQETILRNNLNDNIQISPNSSNKSCSIKKRKINDQDSKVEEDRDFLNTIQGKSKTDYADYAMYIAIRLQNSNQSDRAIAMAKQKIELILCDLETGLFENSFH